MWRQQIRDYWHGKKPLWKAYWLVGAGGSLCFMFLLSLFRENRALFLITFLAFIPFMVWSAVAIWRCAENASAVTWKYLARGLTVWSVLGFFVSMGSYYFNAIELESRNSLDGTEAITTLYDPKEKAAIQQAMLKDFYGKYPELNKPDLWYIVQRSADMTAKQLGKTRWDAELRDKTAERVKLIIADSDAIVKQANTQK